MSHKRCEGSTTARDDGVGEVADWLWIADSSHAAVLSTRNPASDMHLIHRSTHGFVEAEKSKRGHLLDPIVSLVAILSSPELKAGVVAGVLWSPFLFIDFVWLPFNPEVMYSNHPESILLGWMIIVAVAGLDGVVFGGLVGVVFARIKNYIPSHSILVKAIIFAVALWVPLTFVSIIDGSFFPDLFMMGFNLVGNVFGAAVFSSLFRRWSMGAVSIRIQLSERRAGGLVGGLVGLLYGMVDAIEFYFLVAPWSPNLGRIAFSLFGGFALIGGAATGCFLGVLFVAFRRKIPGNSTITKAIIISLILLAIRTVGAGLLIVLDPRNYAAVFQMLIINGAAFPALGLLFGYMIVRRGIR